MYLMYVDESGDCGLNNSPTRYFILSAIVLHELRWRTTLQSLADFRRTLKATKGLKMREEIHATDMINRPGELARIKRNDRVDILKQCIDWLESQEHINVYSIVIDKQGKHVDIFTKAWEALLQRFENTINRKNFKNAVNDFDKGMVISDNTEGDKLRKLIRRMRHYNYVPSMIGAAARNLRVEHIIEDPVFRDSRLSLLHQMNDVLAYCIRQKYEPNAYMRKKGGHKFYTRLNQCLTKAVSSKNNLAIVEL